MVDPGYYSLLSQQLKTDELSAAGCSTFSKKSRTAPKKVGIK